MKITFMGAGSTVFARNVLGDCMCSPALCEAADLRLYDINEERLKDSEIILGAINKNVNESRATIKTYLGVENRKEALRDADFVVNAIQVGGYDPCTITDFEIPKKFGLSQTIADTLGIGGIMRALRTIPVMEEFARDMEEVCPNTLFLNYTNPMADADRLYALSYTPIQYQWVCATALQVCSETLLERKLGMEDKLEGRRELIAGINHMGWLVGTAGQRRHTTCTRRSRRRAAGARMARSENMTIWCALMYIKHLGYYCTESSEHNAEYNLDYYIKSQIPGV
ncbi:MAG: hypothetical protein ACLVAT_12230 [Lachnospiraceae bacterium]